MRPKWRVPNYPLPLNYPLLLALVFLGLAHRSAPCSLAEFECENKRCIQVDKFCNRINDCGPGDESDEPPGCSGMEINRPVINSL